MSRILYGHAPSLTSPLSLVEVEALPSHRVVLSRWSSVLWPPPTSHLASPWTSLLQLMPAVTMAVDHRPDETSPAEYRSLAVFRRLLSQHPAPHTPEGPSRLLPGSSPLPWPSLSLTSSAPSGSRCRANTPTLQDSLHVTGCCFALLPQEDTSLQHNRSPGSTGSLLRGLLAVATVGLPPTSRRQLSGHTSELLGGWPPASDSDQLSFEMGGQSAPSSCHINPCSESLSSTNASRSCGDNTGTLTTR